MPSWGVHIATANKLINMLKIKDEDKDSFLIGNILPDIKNGYIISPNNLDSVIDHNSTHFCNPSDYADNKEFSNKSIKRFFDEYKMKFQNPIVLGYFTHLLTDFYWNKETFNNHYIRNDLGEVIGARVANNNEIKCGKKDGRILKHKDFRYFGYYISKQLNVEIPKYNENMSKDASEIQELSLTNKEIELTINYISEMKEKILMPLDEYEYQMFSKNELENIFKDCINYIYSYLNGHIEE